MIVTPALALLVIALFAAWTVLAWWALFHDRARGRRRCPKCWYDLTHSPGRTCPECGHAAADERKLHRTRRRWRLGVAAIFAGVLQGLLIAQQVQQRGWASTLPLPLVARLAAVPGAVGETAIDEIGRRARGGGFDARAWEQALDASTRVARTRSTGHWHANAAGRLGRAAATSLLALDDPETTDRARKKVLALAALVPPVVQVESTATAWPDLPTTLDVEVLDSLGGLLETRITLAVDGEDAAAWILRDEPIQRRSFGIALPVRPPGTHELALEIRTDRRLARRFRGGDPDDAAAPGAPGVSGAPPGGAEPSWTESTTRASRTVWLEVRPDPRPLDPAPPSPELDEAITRVFRAGLVQWQDGSLPVRVRVDRRATYVEPFEGIAIGLAVEVRRNGRLGRRLDLWWPAGRSGAAAGQAWEVPFHDDAVLGPPSGPDDAWTLVVRGDRRLAARIDGATQWWAGELVLPVSVSVMRGDAPPRGWVAVEVDGDDPPGEPAVSPGIPPAGDA